MVSTRRRAQAEKVDEASLPQAASAPKIKHDSATRTHRKPAQKQHTMEQPHQEEEQPGQQDGSDQQQEAQQPAGQDDVVLDAFNGSETLAQLQQVLQDPTHFLTPDSELPTTIRQACKVLYAYAARALLQGASGADKLDALRALHGGALPLGSTLPQGASAKQARSQPLPELCVGPAFDAEQIWVQLDMATDAALKRTRRLMPKAAALAPGSGGQQEGGRLVKPEHEAAIDAILAGSSSEEGSEEQQGSEGVDDEQLEGGFDGSEDFDDDDEEEEGPSKRRKKEQAGGKRQKLEAGGKYGFSFDDAGGDEDLEALLAEAGSDDDEDEGEDDMDDEGDGDDAYLGRPGQAAGLLPGEDRFMRLKDMEAFLEDAEKRQAGGGGDDDDEVDLDAAAEEGDGGDDDDDLGEGGSEDGGGEDEDEEERQLRRLLNRTAKLAGKKAQQGSSYMYKDFFGPEPQGGAEGEGDDEDDDFRGFREELGMHLGDEEEDGEGDLEGSDDDEGLPSAGAQGKGSKKAAASEELSAHERRLLRMQERIAELEAQALSVKEWTMRGEIEASRRPLNSALEVDMDFDTTVRPPPEPSAEAMADLEAMIKARIADHRFDDVIRIAPPPPERTRKELELDDNKASKGLGELYEEQFVQQTTGFNVVDEKAERLRHEAKLIFQELIAKLDALSHFHYAPKPVIEDLRLHTDVAAVAMEEAAPVGVSMASMRLPEEVYKPAEKGAPKAEGELTKEDRKRKRAAKKRAAKAERKQKEGEARAQAAAAGQHLLIAPASNGAALAGRKSVAAMAAVKAVGGKKGMKQAAKAAASAAGVGAKHHAKTEFGKSSAVFARIQEHADQAKAGVKPGKSKDTAGVPALAAAFLKL